MRVEILCDRSKRCPAGIQEQLTRIGGTNPYGQPMFRFVWARNRTTKALSTGDSGKLAPKIREVLKYDDEDCWHLEKWCPAEVYGSPERWHVEQESMLGGYPFEGEYETCYKYYSLSLNIVYSIVPLIQKAREMTYAERLWRRKEMAAKKDADLFKDMDDAYDDMAPLSYNDVSFAGQKNCASEFERIVDKRKKKIRMTAEDLQKQTGFGSSGFQVGKS